MLQIYCAHILFFVNMYAAVCPPLAIHVVYNAFIAPAQNWKIIVSGQLERLKEFGLPSCSTTHVVLSTVHSALKNNASYSDLETLLLEARALIESILPPKNAKTPGIFVSTVHENSYEFPGLHLLWTLAQSMPENDSQSTIFLYFHTKGMMFHGFRTNRFPDEVELTDGTIGPWSEIAKHFMHNKTTTRIGMFPSGLGWVWMNFFWVRASYVKLLVEPMRVQRRHYYEDWLSRLYVHNTTIHLRESGVWNLCDTCYAFNWNCSGYRVLHVVDIPHIFPLKKCTNISQWLSCCYSLVK